MTERRRFIVKAGRVMAAVVAAAIVDAPNVIAQPKIQWRMSTAWTPALDHLQGAGPRLAKVVKETSGGPLRKKGRQWRQHTPPRECVSPVLLVPPAALMLATVAWTAHLTCLCPCTSN